MSVLSSSYYPRISDSVDVNASRSKTRISTGTKMLGGSIITRRASSVYDTGSTRGKRISSAGGNWSSSYGTGSNDSIVFGHQQAMQNLNARLEIYIKKIRSLDASNNQLDHQINEYNAKRAPVSTEDLSIHERSIADLHTQIYSVSLHNAKLMLEIDNTRLAADDFRIKYESELAISKGVEADMHGLQKAMDELTVAKRDLESQFTELKEDLAYLHCSHQEELLTLRSEMGGSVSVAVESSAPTDLSKILADLRIEYEAIAKKNHEEVEAWYTQKCSTLKQTVAITTDSMQGQKMELTDVRRSLQSQEIELQSLLTMKDVLERNAYDIEIRYSEQLVVFQEHIAHLEENLAQIKSDMQRQESDYALLLDVKIRLEMEIATYRRLLDGEESMVETVIIHDPETQFIKKTIISLEKLVDGNVVSSEIQQVKEEICAQESRTEELELQMSSHY